MAIKKIEVYTLSQYFPYDSCDVLAVFYNFEDAVKSAHERAGRKLPWTHTNDCDWAELTKDGTRFIIEKFKVQ